MLKYFKMENISIYVKQQISRVSFKLLDLSKRDQLQLLSEEFDFEVWELNCTDEFASGLLVFKTFFDAYSFCREDIQWSYLEYNNIWYEDHSGKIASNLLEDLNSALNEDCIDEIGKRVDVLGLADMISCSSSKRLSDIARLRFSNLIINTSTVGSKFGLMNLCYVLNSFGDIVQNITISLRCFRGASRTKWNRKLIYSILHCCTFNALNLSSITLQDFDIQYFNSMYQPIELMLKQKNIVLIMDKAEPEIKFW